MRIWHEKLIPKLCRQHLLAVWREGLGCWKILTENKKGYRNHPAVKEFSFGTGVSHLWLRLAMIRSEMIKRGYNPKPLPAPPYILGDNGRPREWQTLEKQIEILKAKGCKCNV